MNEFHKQIAFKNLAAAQRCGVCLIQETKIQYMSDWFVRQLWYDDNFDWNYFPSVGSSGGMLCIWDSSNPCEYNFRSDFCDDMKEVKSWWNGPICIAGDKNAVRNNEERNEGEGNNRNMAFLNNFITDHDLIDQPLIGGLDRFLFDHLFEEAYPTALQIVLTRTISYHNPILVIIEPTMPSKPYLKLDRVWVEHKDFANNVKNWWEVMSFQGSASTRFFPKLQNLKHLINPWRIQEFGSIGREKTTLTDKIHELNILEESGALQHHHMEERLNYKLKLKNIETLEARKWQLRAKQNNFRWGNDNTRYFHSIASAWRKRSTMVKLQVGGVHCFEQNTIKEEIRDFYVNLFTKQYEVNSQMENLYFPAVKEEDKNWLEREFIEEEV
ncbi:uncharacterized protein LOC113305510 [Papaver somniferum]|uniref:uncharacterized protein LOC113305510 n=1 Tax=Papaver somniferum TaxID=3469 RepID=UPI000E6F54DE|nr:uncharacterized protein LOC113305510 [Papaver somniferum]